SAAHRARARNQPAYSSRVSYLEKLLALFAEERPKRVTPKRGAVREEHHVDSTKHEREVTRPRAALAERDAHDHMPRAPQESHRPQHDERGDGQTGGNLTPAAGRRSEDRQRADGERQRRDADERRQQAPDDEEDADEVNVFQHGEIG